MEQLKLIPIFYINLEERNNKNNEIISELTSKGITNFTRVNAIKHDDGYIGCALSHIKCLDIAIKRGYEKVCIMEDDYIFLDSCDKLKLPDFDYDIFLIGGTIKKYEKENDFLRIREASRTEGYIIKKHYYETLKKCFISSVCSLLNEHTFEGCLDIHWRTLQQKDKFYINDFGLIGGQREGYSDIMKTNMKRKNNWFLNC